MPAHPMIQPSGPKKRKGFKKSTAYAAGATASALGIAHRIGQLRKVMKNPDALQAQILKAMPKNKRLKIAIPLWLAEMLGGALIGRSLQHSYRKSRARAPQSPKARAVAASALKGGVGGLITGPLIGWRDLRSKMGKQYAPLKTL